ncbi:hypothetical protein K0M31_015104 [Melipona bicolor]|uniref:Uncharacterized protein n=1 Tax=Melipona bicolor TaxID=60889 RepID=A0AA40KFJ0_9HYME|nr:hypothetical protein K0M31_015104 [Melipona bicolor]
MRNADCSRTRPATTPRSQSPHSSVPVAFTLASGSAERSQRAAAPSNHRNGRRTAAYHLVFVENERGLPTIALNDLSCIEL